MTSWNFSNNTSISHEICLQFYTCLQINKIHRKVCRNNYSVMFSLLWVFNIFIVKHWNWFIKYFEEMNNFIRNKNSSTPKWILLIRSSLSGNYSQYVMVYSKFSYFEVWTRQLASHNKNIVCPNEYLFWHREKNNTLSSYQVVCTIHKLINVDALRQLDFGNKLQERRPIICIAIYFKFMKIIVKFIQ